MAKSHAPAVREILRNAQDGLPCASIGEAAGLDADAARQTLKSMPDAYIDRWTEDSRGRYQAVWAVVVPPEHCPAPNAPNRLQSVRRGETHGN